MKKILFLLLILSLGCIETGQKQVCNVKYNPTGVAVTDIQVDYAQIYAGNNIRLSVEVANLGDETATDITLNVVGPDNYFTLPSGSVLSSTSMAPPDPNKCIEGELKNKLIVLESKSNKQALDGVPIKLKLKYEYKSHAWTDVVVLSEQQWAVRTQEGYVPKLYSYQSVAPIKINMVAPAVPVVEDSEFQVRLSLENALASPDSKATKGTDAGVVEEVRVMIPEQFEFVGKNDCASTSGRVCVIKDFDVTKDPENVIEKKIEVKLSDPTGLLEENFKINAEADYNYEVFYYTTPIVIISD